MSNQLTSNANALRLFFTEDVYLIKQNSIVSAEPPVAEFELPKIASQTKTIDVPVQPTSPQAVSLPKVEDRKTIVFEHLGKNQKGILILVNDELNKVSSAQGTELLRKLVKAIELTNNDFALVNYTGYSTANFLDFQQFFNCKVVLSFGVDSQQLGLAAFPPNLLQIHENCRFIFAKNLHDLDADPASKKLLWGSLQQLKS